MSKEDKKESKKICIFAVTDSGRWGKGTDLWSAIEQAQCKIHNKVDFILVLTSDPKTVMIDVMSGKIRCNDGDEVYRLTPYALESFSEILKP